MTEFAALASQVSGPVLTPDDPGFADEVSGFNLRFTNTPPVVVGITSVADAVAAVKFAHENRLPITIMATGHGQHAAFTEGMLINTKRMKTVSIDGQIATIGAGAQWGDVITVASPLGLAPITGSSTNVGVVGYLMGGGMGPMSRAYGYSSDYVRSFTVVNADGEVVEASADSNIDLFWALRGGKGGLGLVVEVTIELVELANLYGGVLIYDAPDIEPALRAWVDYTHTADARVSTSVALMHFPDLDFAPPPLRGRTVLMTRFTYPGAADEGEKLAAPLRAAAPVYMDSLAEMPTSQIAMVHQDPVEPGVGWTHGALLTSIDQDFATTLLSLVGPGVQTPFMLTEVRHEGSATDRDVEGGSAVGGRDADYTLNFIGAPNPDLFDHVLPAAAYGAMGALEKWVSPEMNINFVADPLGEDFAKAWTGEMGVRLASIRASVDPDRVFAYGPQTS